MTNRYPCLAHSQYQACHLIISDLGTIHRHINRNKRDFRPHWHQSHPEELFSQRPHLLSNTGATPQLITNRFHRRRIGIRHLPLQRYRNRVNIYICSKKRTSLMWSFFRAEIISSSNSLLESLVLPYIKSKDQIKGTFTKTSDKNKIFVKLNNSFNSWH